MFRSLYKNIFSSFGRQVVTSILNLIILFLIAKNMGAEKNGVYNLIIMIPLIITNLLNLGISASNVYFINSENYDLKQSLRVGFKLNFKIVLIGCILGIFLIEINKSYFENIDVKLLYLSVFLFPLQLINNFLLGLFQATKEFNIYNVLFILQPLILLLELIGLILFDIFNLNTIFMSYFSSYLIIVVFGYFNLVRKIKNTFTNKSVQDDREYTKKILKYGFKAHISNVVAFINNKVDVLMLNYFMGPLAVGIYIIALQIVEKLWIISNSVSSVMLPDIVKLKNDHKGRGEITSYFTRIVIFITFILSIFVAVVFSSFIHIVGDQYTKAILPLIILLPGVIFSSGAKILSNEFAAIGRPEINMYTSWITLSFNIGCNIFLIPAFGINGAALSVSFSYILNFILKLMICNFISGTKLWDLVMIKKMDLLPLLKIKEKK